MIQSIQNFTTLVAACFRLNAPCYRYATTSSTTILPLEIVTTSSDLTTSTVLNYRQWFQTTLGATITSNNPFSKTTLTLASAASASLAGQASTAHRRYAIQFVSTEPASHQMFAFVTPAGKVWSVRLVFAHYVSSGFVRLQNSASVFMAIKEQAAT